MHYKYLIWASLFFARKQGSEEDQVSFMEFAVKAEGKDDGSYDFEVSKVLKSFSLTSLKDSGALKSELTRLIDTTVEYMPYSSRAAPWSSKLTTNAFMQDLQLKETRKLLVELLNLKKQTNDVRALAIRLLFRMGMIFASPVDLLLAA